MKHLSKPVKNISQAIHDFLLIQLEATGAKERRDTGCFSIRTHRQIVANGPRSEHFDYFLESDLWFFDGEVALKVTNRKLIADSRSEAKRKLNQSKIKIRFKEFYNENCQQMRTTSVLQGTTCGVYMQFKRRDKTTDFPTTFLCYYCVAKSKGQTGIITAIIKSWLTIYNQNFSRSTMSFDTEVETIFSFLGT